MANKTKPKARKAESDAGATPRKKVKVQKDSEPQKSITVKKKIIVKKREDNQFKWKSFAEDNPVRRLEIKEEAVRQGLSHGNKVASALRQMLNAAEGQTESNEPGLLGSSASLVQDWLGQFDDVKTKHSNFRVFIGFAGATGAGKTAAINSIIGLRDLLPSSTLGAATAVPCLIGYNEDLQHAFRAEIKFQEKDDIKKVLDQYFETLRQRTAQAENDGGDDGDDDGERMASGADPLLDAGEEGSQDVREMVSRVFGLDEQELNMETTDSVFSKNPTALQLLGSTMFVEENNIEVFSEKIKPYMDSVTADHGDNGYKFAAWPLIRDVKIFVRSDVLRNGIVLVDLPGLSDNVESRATVARDYFQKLSVTAIVTPIIRARDEQTGVQLMTENQQVTMQMDGKYHKNSFCVILSKMDDMDVNTHLKQHGTEAKSDLALQGWQSQSSLLKPELANLKKEQMERAKIVKAIEVKIRNAQAANDANTVARKRELNALRQQKTDEMAKSFEVDSLISKNRKQTEQLQARIHHWCLQHRNAIVKHDIQQDFAKRQKRLMLSTTRKDLYDGKVEIFPISSSAFWKVRDDDETPLGFPTAQYTGVPAFTHWLRYATVPDREKHLDEVLKILHVLFNTVNTWSCNDKTKLKLTSEFVEAEVLHKPLKKLQSTLDAAFKNFQSDIKALNPMKNKTTTVANCKARCMTIAQEWALKSPNDRLSKVKMHHQTYNACVWRSGAPYISSAKGRPRYAWIESLCNLFYDGIVGEWNSALNEKIPALAKPSLTTVDTIWGTFMQQLEARVSGTAPELNLLFQKEQGSFEQIKELIKDQVAKKFEAIGTGAQKIHRSVTESVKAKFEPAFDKARKETGKGSFDQQQLWLTHKAQRCGNNMFKDSTEDIEEQLKVQLGSLKKEFDKVTEEALHRVKQHVILMLKTASNTQPDDESSVQLAPEAEEKAQRMIRRIVSEWAAHWRMGDYVDLTIETMDMAIPERYYDPNEDDAVEDDVDQDEAVKDQAADGKVIEEEAVGDRAGEKEVVGKEAVEMGEPKDSVASKGGQGEGEQMVTE